MKTRLGRRSPTPRRTFCLLLASGTALACSPVAPYAPKADPLTEVRLHHLDGQAVPLGALLSNAKWSVFVFFSSGCPTVAAHDARLVQLWQDYERRGVAVYAVASEAEARPERLRAERQRRGYPFPLLWDPGAVFARALGVRYASQALILDRSGAVQYAGSIDSDRRFLHSDAQPYLRTALDALLRDSPPPTPDSRAFGCALRW